MSVSVAPTLDDLRIRKTRLIEDWSPGRDCCPFEPRDVQIMLRIYEVPAAG